MLDFVKLGPAGTAEKVTSLNPYPRQFRNQKFNFSIPAHLPGRFSEDRLISIGDIKRQINIDIT